MNTEELLFWEKMVACYIMSDRPQGKCVSFVDGITSEFSKRKFAVDRQSCGLKSLAMLQKLLEKIPMVTFDSFSIERVSVWAMEVVKEKFGKIPQIKALRDKANPHSCCKEMPLAEAKFLVEAASDVTEHGVSLKVIEAATNIAVGNLAGWNGQRPHIVNMAIDAYHEGKEINTSRSLFIKSVSASDSLTLSIIIQINDIVFHLMGLERPASSDWASPPTGPLHL